MRRREFIKLLGGAAAAWPITARAQQAVMPVIGYLSTRSAATDVPMVEAFRRGLDEMGYVDGTNVTVEFRWGDGEYDRLPALAAELVQRQVDVIVTSGSELSAKAAKATTTKIPIVFTVGSDPVRLGLVASLNRPGGNLTGVSSILSSLGSKNLSLLRELIPSATVLAVLVNPNDASSDRQLDEIQAAANSLGQEIIVFRAGTEREIDAAFTMMIERGASAALVTIGPYYLTRAEQFAVLAAQHRMPVMYGRREYVLAGGLLSYGASTAEYYQQLGLYAGKILRGAKPADLPVVMPTKFELVISLKAAKALNLDVPAKLLALADEVIE